MNSTDSKRERRLRGRRWRRRAQSRAVTAAPRPVKDWSGLDPLELRLLLNSHVPANVFAQLQGDINQPADIEPFNIEIASQDFNLASGSVNLGFHVLADVNSSLDPDTVEIRDSAGNVITPLIGNANVGGGDSVVVADLPLGVYDLMVGGENNTTGAFNIDVYLVGDANGDRTVDRADQRRGFLSFGRTPGQAGFAPDADANLDGRITSLDIAFMTRNLGDSTTLDPLDLSLDIAPPAAAGEAAGRGRSKTPRPHQQGNTPPGGVVG